MKTKNDNRPRIMVNSPTNEVYKFYINPYQSDLDAEYIACHIDLADDNRPISKEWRRVGYGDVNEINAFLYAERCLIVAGRFSFSGVRRRWQRFQYRFKDDNKSRFDQLKEGDILKHRNKTVIAVLDGDTWGYLNNGEFVPFFGCEEYPNAIRWKDGEYWDLDFAERIGNAFEKEGGDQ